MSNMRKRVTAELLVGGLCEEANGEVFDEPELFDTEQSDTASKQRGRDETVQHQQKVAFTLSK